MSSSDRTPNDSDKNDKTSNNVRDKSTNRSSSSDDGIIDVYVLRALRKSRGWNQKTLAAKAGFDASILSRIERNLQIDLRASVLTGLARALETTVDSLLTDQARFHFGNLPRDRAELQQKVFELLAGSGTTRGLLERTDLATTLVQLADLSNAQQRQVASLLRAYLSTVFDFDDVDNNAAIDYDDDDNYP